MVKSGQTFFFSYNFNFNLFCQTLTYATVIVRKYEFQWCSFRFISLQSQNFREIYECNIMCLCPSWENNVIEKTFLCHIDEYLWLNYSMRLGTVESLQRTHSLAFSIKGNNNATNQCGTKRTPRITNTLSTATEAVVNRQTSAVCSVCSRAFVIALCLHLE